MASDALRNLQALSGETRILEVKERKFRVFISVVDGAMGMVGAAHLEIERLDSDGRPYWFPLGNIQFTG